MPSLPSTTTPATTFPCAIQRRAGYVLFDALVALLLLATALLGAGAALVQSLAASHAAAMQTAAVDLAADLTESLQVGAASRETVVAQWQADVARKLPSGMAAAELSGTADAGSGASRIDLSIHWHDRAGAPRFGLRLPYVAPYTATPP